MIFIPYFKKVKIIIQCLKDKLKISINWEEMDILPKTSRGASGFGSTGTEIIKKLKNIAGRVLGKKQ